MQNSMPFQMFQKSQYRQNGTCDYIALTRQNVWYIHVSFHKAFKTVTRHNKTGHLSLTKEIVIFLLSKRAFYQLKGDTSPV